MEMKQINKVSIALKPNVYSTFRNLNNTVSNTLGEYVDNAVQSFLSENPFPSISQDAEHRAVGLFFGEQAGVVFVVVLVPVDDDVFRDGGVMRTVAGNSYIMIT